MVKTVLVHPSDDMVVALRDLDAGESCTVDGQSIQLLQPVPAKHKFTRRAFAKGQPLKMYGTIVGKTNRDLAAGQLLETSNFAHATEDIDGAAQGEFSWTPPDVAQWTNTMFKGFHRPDGSVGIRNYWIVVPLVFCQNRNIRVLRESMLEQLGYARPNRFRYLTEQLVELHQKGANPQSLLDVSVTRQTQQPPRQRAFPNVDGIKFLTHEGGCGGLYSDAHTLCGLLAGYINHPNVAGATVLSLGCQKSQIKTLESELHRRNPDFAKPLHILEQQAVGTEDALLEKALRCTVSGVATANETERQPAQLSHLVMGVECGGSDGFSGLSANPAIGHCSDLLVGLGGSVILSEFPELAGCENNLMARCVQSNLADRFLSIMRAYQAHAEKDGGGFDQNPSPGNIADGLITDAIKSAGAARKGGSSPIVDVLDYPEPVTKPGLNLLCTPGGDVESTTAMAGSGATIQLFSTGLGTPTGNPVSPVLKISSNTELTRRMPDIIDVNAGSIIDGTATIQKVGSELLQTVIQVANGERLTCAELLGQDDFIPWKRGISI